MNYREFNQRVYKYYLENLIPGEYNTLTIPKSDFDELIENETYIRNFIEIKNDDWSSLLKYDGEIPKYLGLLAIQCHAAFYMQNDGGLSAGNFRDRFIVIGGINCTPDLHQLFSEKFDDKLNIQEKIWIAAKSFFEKENILLDIPQPKSYAGRNTQFPESQCVLNYQDLKEYDIFYRYIYTNYDIIHFDDFITEFIKFKARLIGQFKRKNNLKIITENEEKIKKRQIFDFFNSMDWLRLEERQLGKKSINKDFIAKLNSDKVVIYDEDFEIFKSHIDLLDKNLLALFKQEEVYTTEFTKTNHIEKNASFIIITSSRKIFIELIIFNGKKIDLDSAPPNLYGVLIDLKDKLPSCLCSYESREFPVNIIGKKISSKKQYLLSKPPRIVAEKGIQYRLYCNNNRIVEQQPILPGKYLIKVNGYSSYAFEIIEDVKLEYEILEPEYQFNLSQLEYSIDGIMSGLGIKAINGVEEKILSVNQWIKSLTNRQTKKNKSINTSFLFKAINQHKYGKY